MTISSVGATVGIGVDGVSVANGGVIISTGGGLPTAQAQRSMPTHNIATAKRYLLCFLRFE